jgi:hypothetical protein
MTELQTGSAWVMCIALGGMILCGLYYFIPAVRRWYLLTCRHQCSDCRRLMVSYMVRGCGADDRVFYCPKLTHNYDFLRSYNPCGEVPVASPHHSYSKSQRAKRRRNA